MGFKVLVPAGLFVKKFFLAALMTTVLRNLWLAFADPQVNGDLSQAPA